MNSTIRHQALQPDPDFRTIGLALLVSLILHLSLMRALPWLETIKTKPLPDIIAELQMLAPPPPPPSSLVETPVEPKTPKVVNAPKSVIKPQPAPLLISKQADSTSTYTAPEIPQLATVPNEPSTPAPDTPKAAEPVATSPASAKSINLPAATSNFTDSEVWDEYGSNLQKLCERNKRYPEIARRRGYEGSVKVMIRYSAEGKVSNVSIESSSGQSSLDEQALEMVKKSLNELPLPAQFKGREFKITIPIDFKLE